MSEFIKIKPVIPYLDKEALVSALKVMGYNPEVHEEEDMHLYGYHSDMREQKACIRIHRNQLSHASNDVGFFKNEKTGAYDMWLSEFDRGYHTGKKLIDQLPKAYKIQQVKQKVVTRLQRERFRVTEVSPGVFEGIRL